MAGLTTRHLALFSYLITPFACDGVHIALKMVYLLTLRVMSDCCAQTDTLRRICCRLYRAHVCIEADGTTLIGSIQSVVVTVIHKGIPALGLSH